MILFLTSSPGGYPPTDDEHRGSPVCERNGLRARMKEVWPKEPATVMAIASDPDDREMNEGMAEHYTTMFAGSGLPVKTLHVVDGDHAGCLDGWLDDCQVLILSGGHVPTENRFFTKLGLREKLKSYDGIVIGISAGTMNSADCVYAQPELAGESVDPAYERFLTGLNLTKLNVLPHYEVTKDEILDGKRLFEDITCPDSFGRTFYALEDGSYVYGDGTKELICGKAYEIKDGKIRLVCEEDERISVL